MTSCGCLSQPAPGFLKFPIISFFFRIDADVNAGQPSVPGSVLSYA